MPQKEKVRSVLERLESLERTILSLGEHKLLLEELRRKTEVLLNSPAFTGHWEITNTEKAKPSKHTLELDRDTSRRLAIQAQFMGMKNKEELALIALRAFLEMAEEGGEIISFPLMLQQVPS